VFIYLFARSPQDDILDLAILSLPSKSKKRILVLRPFAPRLLLLNSFFYYMFMRTCCHPCFSVSRCVQKIQLDSLYDKSSVIRSPMADQRQEGHKRQNVLEDTYINNYVN
jgi:hypothetical protein